MKVLLTTAQTFTPESYGGLQASGNQLAVLLKQRGHDVSFLCTLIGKSYIGLRARVIMKLFKQNAASDTTLGYPVWRGWFPWEGMGFVVNKTKPDIVVVLARLPVKMALAAKAAGADVVMMLQDVEFDAHGGEFKDLGTPPCVANSAFTAQRYRETYGVDPVVIHPMVDGTKYKTSSTRENVTFINPHKSKGVDVVLAVAKACPTIPFAIYESWPLSDEQRAELNAALAVLPNVTLNSPVKDMKKVYGKAKILMAPSVWEEAYGRVATEAQFSGIPVVASNRGGLPEAVGAGGVLLDPEGPIEPWIEAITRLWNDAPYYDDMAKKAEEYAQRPALNQKHQMDLWEQTLLKAAANSKARKTNAV